MSPDPKTHFFIETRGNDFAVQQAKVGGGFEDVLIVPIGQKGFYQICAYMQDYFFSSSKGVMPEKLELYELSGQAKHGQGESGRHGSDGAGLPCEPSNRSESGR